VMLSERARERERERERERGSNLMPNNDAGHKFLK
jgi:hypothetical protein